MFYNYFWKQFSIQQKNKNKNKKQKKMKMKRHVWWLKDIKQFCVLKNKKQRLCLGMVSKTTLRV